MTTTLDVALRCAARGWNVFPCRPGAKVPLTKHGLLDASKDPDAIRRMWQPSANLGIRCGPESGLLVLDADGELGADNLHELELSYQRLPRTLTVKTPNGQHYYFSHGAADIRNSAGQLATAVDVRAAGGYVVAPPSKLIDGRRYEVDEAAPVAPLPTWLGGLLITPTREQRKPEPVTTWLRMVRWNIAEGQRNESLARFAGHLFHHNVDPDLVSGLTHLINDQRCKPPLDDHEVERIVESIAGRELAKRDGRR
jgi:hypothetical protein